MSKLNPQQQRFVEEYIVDLNATQAAIRAGYSEKTARSQGQRLLTNADIQAAITVAVEERSKRTQITADRVLEELAQIGFSDLRKLFTPAGSLLKPEDWPDDIARAVASVEVVTRNIGEGEVEHVAKLKTWDKPRALEMIAKHLGMLKDRVEHTGKDGGPVEFSFTLDNAGRNANGQA